MQPTWPMPNDVVWREIDGYPLAYRDQGNGPVLVMLHGAVNDYRTWAPVFGLLARKCRVIAPSLRHYYPEPWRGNSADFSVAQQASDIARLIEILSGGPVHLLGWSRGARVAIDVAHRVPLLIKSLLFEDASIDIEGGSTSQPLPTQSVLPIVRNTIEEGNCIAAAKLYVDTMFGAGVWDAGTDLQRAMVVDNLHTVFVHGRPPVSRQDIERLRVPLLLMTGQKSPPRYGAIGEAVRRLLPLSESIVVQGAGHAVHIQNPEAFAESVLEFVGRHA